MDVEQTSADQTTQSPEAPAGEQWETYTTGPGDTLDTVGQRLGLVDMAAFFSDNRDVLVLAMLRRMPLPHGLQIRYRKPGDQAQP